MTDTATLVKSWIHEVVNKRNVDWAAAQYLAPGFKAHAMDLRGELGSPDAFKAFFKSFYAAFPDAHAEVEEVIADGDVAAARIKGSGTHRGTFMGVPATNRSATFSILAMYHLREARITDAWTLWDFAGLFRQLGASPPGTPPAVRA